MVGYFKIPAYADITLIAENTELNEICNSIKHCANKIGLVNNQEKQQIPVA